MNMHSNERREDIGDEISSVEDYLISIVSRTDNLIKFPSRGEGGGKVVLSSFFKSLKILQ